MRNFVVLVLLILFVAAPAMAQETPKTEFFVGYQYLHLNPGGRGCHGFDLNLTYNVKDWVGGVGDFGYCKETGLASGVNGHDFNYLFGPRATYRNSSRFVPYGQVLLGGQNESLAGASANSFAITLGGGVDYRYNDRFSLRIMQVEYLWNHFNGTGWNNARITAGLVYKW